MIKVKRKLIKFSNYSLCITVPKKMVENLGWNKGDLLNLYFNEQEKTIKMSKKKVMPDTGAIKSSLSLEEPIEKPVVKKIEKQEPVVLYQRNTNKNQNDFSRW